jgi:hypothetical protein
MPKKYNNSRICKSFDFMIDNIELFFVKNVSFSTSVYSKDVIIPRVIQIISGLELPSFRREFSKDSNRDVFDNKVIKLKRFKYDTEVGSISINFVFFFKRVTNFISIWFYIIYISISTKDSGFYHKNFPITLLYGTQNFDFSKNPVDFINFCKGGNIGPLIKSNFILLEGDKSFNNQEFLYRKNPILALFSAKKLSLFEFFKFLFLHINAAFQYFKLIIKSPVFAILDEDFSYYAAVLVLNKKNAIKDIVLTVANHTFQPLWLSDIKGKKFKTHMLWYAKSTIWLDIYKFDDFRYTTRTTFRHIKIDETWSWTSDFSKYLKDIGVTGVFHDVGPILFYQPNNVEFFSNNNSINIVIFDATPRKIDFEDSAFGTRNTHIYGTLENLTIFLEDIISVSKSYGKLINKSVDLVLKHKREFHSFTDSRYIDLVDELSNKHKSLKVVSHDVNLYSLIGGSDLVIALPYSSTAYISDHLNTPAVFYDATRELIPVYEKGINIAFASGKHELSVFFEQAIKAST